MAGDAGAVENRLNQAREGKRAGVARARRDFRRRATERKALFFNVLARVTGLLVATDATATFAVLKVNFAPHRLNGAPGFVDRLEI